MIKNERGDEEIITVFMLRRGEELIGVTEG
jgi:hypothetical protein